MAKIAFLEAKKRLTDAHNFQFVARDFELDFVFRERESINTFGIVLVSGAWILLQDFNEGAALFLGQFVQLLGWLYMHFDLADGLGKSAYGFGVCVGVGEVRLDVDYWSAVHEIGSTDDNFRPFGRVEINTFNLYARKRDRIRAETGTCRKDTQAFVAAESWRTYCRAPSAPNVLGENPHDPEVAKAFETAESIGIAELRLKAYGRTQTLHKSTLPRNAKLLMEVALDSCNDFKRQLLHDFVILVFDFLSLVAMMLGPLLMYGMNVLFSCFNIVFLKGCCVFFYKKKVSKSVQMCI